MQTINEASKECINTLRIGSDNLEYIGKSEKINGSLLVSISNIFKAGVEFAEEWISVEDELPNFSENVIVRCKNKNKEDGIWLHDMTFIDEETNTWNQKVRQNWEIITHWRPINRK